MNTEYTSLWLEYKNPGYDIEKISLPEPPDDEICSLTAAKELRTAISSMFPSAILTDDAGYTVTAAIDNALGSEEYSLECTKNHARIVGGSSKGLLYGVFAYIRKLACSGSIPVCTERVAPANPMRMLDHWDNPNGSIERGYSGKSFFLEDGQIVVNERTEFFARAAASSGINGIVINNVNVGAQATRFITEEYYPSLNKLADVFERYGITLFLSIDFAAPIDIGGMDSSDPLDERVIGWWNECCKKLFTSVHNFGGFLVKADSEGRPGPFTYNRTHADGANMLARAIKPYGGCVIWRCFVYNCRQNWRDRKTDRARAAFDNFLPLDGKFDDNVILQIKNGPMDFQIREPVHPLFGAMKNTNLMLEVQIAQEYTGQQRHVCYLMPMFREILDFHTYASENNDTVADIISSRGRFCGIATVSNTGDDTNWTGSDLAAANLYGFGRIAFEKDITPEKIADEWCRMTLGNDSEVVSKVSSILLNSRRVYENYTAPLGMGWLCTPANHYGPAPLGYEFDRWGTYHYADRDHVGQDRSDKGTGYALLYNAPLDKIYNSPESCPDELILFFHRLPYDFKLKSGKTLIQHIYDTHFEGYDEAVGFSETWNSLEGKIDKRIFDNGVERFKMQLSCAIEWRDIINSFFFRLSGIPDEKGRKIY